jgi:hypothetical protein
MRLLDFDVRLGQVETLDSHEYALNRNLLAKLVRDLVISINGQRDARSVACYEIPHRRNPALLISVSMSPVDAGLKPFNRRSLSRASVCLRST